MTKRNKKNLRKVVAIKLVLAILMQISFPTASMALTNGPSQPEVETFTPIATSEMVDLASGNFNYNIPLMDVEGYPLNIAYNSGATMDQEATCVGLGWNLNVGSLTRTMRGLPDDFKGEEVVKELKYEPNWTVGLGAGVGDEVMGIDAAAAVGLNLHVGQNIVYNNYTGLSIEPSFGATISAGNKLKDKKTRPYGLGVDLRSTSTGLTVSPSVSYTRDIDKAGKQHGSTKMGISINSIQGLKALTLSRSVSTSVDNKKEGKDRKSVGGSNSGTISFGYQTYIPEINMPMRNLSFAASFKGGVSIFTADGTFDFNAYYARQGLTQNSITSQAYGYLYEKEAQYKADALMDFNREKDGEFNKYTPYLPVTNHTYDIYAATGQGVGGTYRPFRSDIGFVHDKEVSSEPDLSFDAGVELGAGEAVKIGVDVSVNVVQNYSGTWSSQNNSYGKLKFQDQGSTGKPDYEGVYFKQAGEKNVDSDPSLYNTIGTENAVRLDLQEGSKFNVSALDNFTGSGTIPSQNYRNKRQKRNQAFSYLTKADYQNGAFQTDMYSQLSSSSKNHHVAEITILRPDGVRYIYGLPAYNTLQKEVSFNCSGSLPDNSANSTTKGLSSYLDNDVSISKDNGNNRGKNHMVTRTTTPAYAHAYMLTAAVSADYVDIDNNGPTPNDFGGYTKFSYEKIPNYNWRVPYDDHMASYNEGLKSLSYDDMGNYTYGEKELLYVNKIETKNYVAVFEMADRRDGYDVAGENGGVGSHTMKLVKSISLYSRPDYYTSSGSVNTSATPIKTVHFVYNYELCRGVKNNLTSYPYTLDPTYEVDDNGTSNTYIKNRGKLTLKKLYFTYQNSYRAKLNDYEFNYSSQNPDYDGKKYDRWGKHKEPLAGLSNDDFPYAEQDKTQADANANAWNMVNIKLPSGGEINVQYEADDYAYVQNEKATKMIRIAGVIAESDLTTNNGNGTLYDYSPSMVTSNPSIVNSAEFNLQDKNVLVFKKDNATIPASDYLKGIDNLYFRCMVNINQEVSNNGFEYVSGYAKVKSVADLPANSAYGYIALDFVDLADSKISRNVNPITKAAVQFGRLHTFNESFNQSGGVTGGTFKEVLDFLMVGLVVDLFDFFKGPNGTLFDKGLGQQIQPYKSFIKLSTPTGYKYGGDDRVKSLSLSDKWDVMSGQTPSDYGQVYDYTTVENGKTISSGVASYEPQIGADENAIKKPVFYQTHALLAPDDEFYTEEPFGESFYPSPNITYSKVTVRNTPRTGVTANATGKIVHEFYTTKDYPTVTSRTYIYPDVSMYEHKSNPIAQLLKFNVRHFMTASQGYSVVLNDMDGKQKAQWVYQENKTEPISGVEYFYKDNGTTNSMGVKTPGNRINNTASVITKAGQVQQGLIGVDYDFISDFREHSTDVSNYAGQYNNYGVVIIIPVILPPIWFSAQTERTQLRTAVVTKVIHKYALLEKTVAHDLGSKVTTENLAYDAETGETLLTKVVNEFDDPVYNFSYPAHWPYDGMGQAYKNIGFTLSGVNINSVSNAKNYFFPGDELLLTYGGNTQKAWVKTVGTTTISLMDISGLTINPGTSADLKIIRSGRKNQQSLAVGSVSSLTNPIDANGDGTNDASFPAINETYRIIQANAIEFGNRWKTFCNCGVGGSSTNDYLTGVLGNYRAVKSYLYLTGRLQTKFNKNSDLRKDGQYADFQGFWTANSGNDWTAPTNLGTTSKWTFTSEVTDYSPYGFELENRDALGRYSSAVYGYNNTLPVSVSANSKYNQSGSDNFEDYDFRPCVDDHFSFKKNLSTNNTVNTQESHTGKKSLKVAPGQSINITRDLNACPQ